MVSAIVASLWLLGPEISPLAAHSLCLLSGGIPLEACPWVIISLGGGQVQYLALESCSFKSGDGGRYLLCRHEGHKGEPRLPLCPSVNEHLGFTNCPNPANNTSISHLVELPCEDPAGFSTIFFFSAIGFGFGPLTLAVIRCNVLPLKLVPLRVERAVVAFLAAVRVTKANPVCLFVGLSTGSLVSVIGQTLQTTPKN